MPDEAYASSPREHHIDPNGASSGGLNSFSPNISHTSPTTDSIAPIPLSSPPRSSSESAGRTSSSKWRESLSQATLERRDTITTITTNPDTANVVEPNFDEHVLRMLCGLDVSGSLYGGPMFETQDPRLITVFRPVVTGQDQTEHGLLQGESSNRSPPFPDADHVCRRRRFSSRRGLRWRTSTPETCRNLPARPPSSTR